MWINPETLELLDAPADGCEVVLPTQMPLTGRLEKAVRGAPERLDGMWYETWIVEPLTDAEAAQVVEAERVNARHTRPQLTAANNAAFEAAIGSLTADYPPSEIATWERQRAEAIAWEADPQAATPWIDTAALARQLDREVYLTRTVAKVHAFAQASAYLTGRRQFIDDAIRAAETAEDLAGVQIDYTLPGAP